MLAAEKERADSTLQLRGVVYKKRKRKKKNLSISRQDMDKSISFSFFFHDLSLQFNETQVEFSCIEISLTAE